MNLISFQLVTPERTVLKEELVSLTCPTTLGEITILPNHASLVANLVPGQLRAKSANGKESSIYVAGGFVHVERRGPVTVLADGAEHDYEIDVEAAQEAKVRAEKAMKEHATSSEEYARVAAALQQSLARIHVARKHGGKRAVLDDSSSND